MIKEVVRALETGLFAEIALVAFLFAFVLILIWTFSLSSRFRDAAKNLPLEDAEPFPPENNHG